MSSDPHTIYPAFPTSIHHARSLVDGAFAGYDPQSSTIPLSFIKDDAASGSAHDSTPPPVHTTGAFDMLPPPSSKHATWQALHDYAQSHAAEHGYALSINTTAKNRSRIKLACVCYGRPKNTHKLTPETRVRKNRVSYKTGCRMWIEGRKQEDGTWLLGVGEAQHNHAGRPGEAWAVQRKRTWGAGGRMGVGGVTAKEESAKMGGQSQVEEAASDEEDGGGEHEDTPEQALRSNNSLEHGGLIWSIIEQEMLRGPSLGRDRGVGRTVDVLRARLPGIHILKRDIYNIRARIRRARQATGQQVGDGVHSNDEATQEAAQEIIEEENENEEEQEDPDELPTQRSSLFRQPDQRHTSLNTQLRDSTQADLFYAPHYNTTSQVLMAPSQVLSASNAEVEQLRREVVQLKSQLGEKTQEIKEKTIEIAGLSAQVQLLRSMAGMGMSA